MNLELAEILILNSASQGRFPIDCFFRSETTYRLCFAEEWHGLKPNACWLAMAKLIESNLLEVVRRDSRELNDLAVPREVILLGLTCNGGRVWEELCQVKWGKLIWSEAGKESAGYAEYVFRAATESQLERLRKGVLESEYRGLVTTTRIRSQDGWRWSNWKTFESSFQFTVKITSKVPGVEFTKAQDFLFAYSDRLARDFKIVPSISAMGAAG